MILKKRKTLLIDGISVHYEIHNVDAEFSLFELTHRILSDENHLMTNTYVIHTIEL